MGPDRYIIRCDSCGALGHAEIYDEGDRVNGTFWPAAGVFDGFDSVWHQDGPGAEPVLVSATCKKCGGKASLVEEHMDGAD
jgi:hypothetical protein